MLYSEICGERVSLLGFGAMRLPTSQDGEVDEAAARALIDRAIAGGINYFDTAYPYHGGLSEVVLGRALSRYPRDSYYLADKYPGHQIMKRHDPRAILEDQLKRCGTDYFDFYLLHNVCESSMDTYTDPSLGIVEYFLGERERGRIRHLGFSTHARPDALRSFLDRYGDCLEFCQIQLNYLDDTLQNAREKYDMLTERGIPVIVMEPVRGGKLARLSEPDEDRLHRLRPTASIASFAFRWLMELDGVRVILSGMSDMAQLEDNLSTLSRRLPLTHDEHAALSDIAEKMKRSVPCTACRYCTDGCPQGLDIPTLLSVYNELSVARSVNTSMLVELLPEEKQPAACISCGACSAICPQRIDIPNTLHRLSELLSDMPSWRSICREREEARERLARMGTEDSKAPSVTEAGGESDKEDQ